MGTTPCPPFLTNSSLADSVGPPLRGEGQRKDLGRGALDAVGADGRHVRVVSSPRLQVARILAELRGGEKLVVQSLPLVFRVEGVCGLVEVIADDEARGVIPLAPDEGDQARLAERALAAGLLVLQSDERFGLPARHVLTKFAAHISPPLRVMPFSLGKRNVGVAILVDARAADDALSRGGAVRGRVRAVVRR